MADAPDIMTANKATSWAQRSQRTLRAGPSQELRRRSHQFRSDLSQDFQTPNLTNPAPNHRPRRADVSAIPAVQHSRSGGRPTIERERRPVLQCENRRLRRSVGAFPALKREQHMGFGRGSKSCPIKQHYRTRPPHDKPGGFCATIRDKAPQTIHHAQVIRTDLELLDDHTPDGAERLSTPSIKRARAKISQAKTGPLD